MIKRKLKPFVVPMFYILAVVLFGGSIYLIQNSISDIFFSSNNENTNYVDKEIIEDNKYIPVVNTEKSIIKPYLNEKVTIAKNFYDYEAETNDQQNAIIYYENIYMQNSGIDYNLEEPFDVVSILDGTVVKVEETDMLGYSVQIRHSNDIISVYQSLTNVSVKENDTVTQGQVIAQSGESNINKDLGAHLHFELYYKGLIVNPEQYYNKSLKEL